MGLELEHQSNALFLKQNSETDQDCWRGLIQLFAKEAISKTQTAYFISLGTSKDDEDFCNEMKDVRYFTFPTFAACMVDGAVLGRATETAEFEDGFMFWLISKPKDDETLKDWAEFFQHHHKNGFKPPFTDLEAEIITLKDEGRTLIWINPSIDDAKVKEIAEAGGFQVQVH
ncbi:hypothetical protein FO519_008726 [Halicephalobus sp. NKZ332]|nr:hypothetical protein FO519_008726 [Halicephalobus sp. NKZ332]